MPKLPRTDQKCAYYEGVTQQDKYNLQSVLAGRTIDPAFARRLAEMGWIDTFPQGPVLTLAGRCVIDHATTR